MDGAVPFVRIDPLRMNQAVDNLVATAITLSKPGSKIEVRMHAQNDVVSIAAETKDQALRWVNGERFSRSSG